jgi:hypothetical protein
VECESKSDTGNNRGDWKHFKITHLSNIPGKLKLTLYLLTWRIWGAPNNASKGQMGFNSAFKGLRNYKRKSHIGNCIRTTGRTNVKLQNIARAK